MDVELANVTGAVAAVNAAGPDARRLMERLCDIDVSGEAFTYLDAKHAHVAGVPALILRIGFVGELGYEIHFPSPHGEHVWDALLDAGKEWNIAAFGLEPQRILRLEKMHILVGQDTDSESNPLEAAMPWIVKLDKDDFVGKWSIEQVAERGLNWMLVGFEMANGRAAARGRPGRRGRRLGRAGHQRAPQRGARQGHRHGDRPARARRGRHDARHQDRRDDRAGHGHDEAVLRPRGSTPVMSASVDGWHRDAAPTAHGRQRRDRMGRPLHPARGEPAAA